VPGRAGTAAPLRRSASAAAWVLISGMAALPAGVPGRPPVQVWVHCQGGYRASAAASLLAAAGHQVTLVDDDYSRAAAAGLPLTGGAVPAAPAA
jgi:hypothetical protein